MTRKSSRRSRTSSNLLERVAWIGAGNMAEAMVRALVASGFPAKRITVSDVRPERREYFHRTLGVAVAASNLEAVRDVTLAVLAVKPQVLESVASELRGVIPRTATVLSIAAGVTTGSIEEWLQGRPRVVRAMPNTPAMVRSGATVLCPGSYARELDLQRAEAVLRPMGLVERVPEAMMDAVTAISGSGPAYVFFLIECLSEAAAQFGLDPSVARRLILATVEGAARLLRETGLDAAEARRRVTSEKGTTEAAMKVLEARGVRDAWLAAFEAARRRAAELAHSR